VHPGSGIGADATDGSTRNTTLGVA
jgi:hypothetical protein